MPFGVHKITLWVLCAAIIFGAIIPLMVSTNNGIAQDRIPLFSYVSETEMSDSQNSQLARYRVDPTFSTIKLITINTALIQPAGQYTVDLLEEETIQLQRMRIEERTPSSFTLFGSTLDDDNEVTLVVDGMDVSGTIRKGRQLYSVRPLGGGIQALILVNQDAFPPDEPPGFDEEMNERMPMNDLILDDSDYPDQSSIRENGTGQISVNLSTTDPDNWSERCPNTPTHSPAIT